MLLSLYRRLVLAWIDAPYILCTHLLPSAEVVFFSYNDCSSSNTSFFQEGMDGRFALITSSRAISPQRMGRLIHSSGIQCCVGHFTSSLENYPKTIINPNGRVAAHDNATVLTSHLVLPLQSHTTALTAIKGRSIVQLSSVKWLENIICQVWVVASK